MKIFHLNDKTKVKSEYKQCNTIFYSIIIMKQTIQERHLCYIIWLCMKSVEYKMNWAAEGIFFNKYVVTSICFKQTHDLPRVIFD